MADVISQRQNNQTYYYMLDGIHNVYQVLDSLLAIRNTYDYDWFRYMTQRNEEIRNDYHVSLWTTLYLDYSLYQAEQLCYQALYGRNIQMPFNNARFYQPPLSRVRGAGRCIIANADAVGRDWSVCGSGSGRDMLGIEAGHFRGLYYRDSRRSR